jgi:hypothetical protein
MVGWTPAAGVQCSSVNLPQGCELNSKIVYVEFTAVVRRQKEILKMLVERRQEQIRQVKIRAVRSLKNSRKIIRTILG